MPLVRPLRSTQLMATPAAFRGSQRSPTSVQDSSILQSARTKALHDGSQKLHKSWHFSCHWPTLRLQSSCLPARARAPRTPAPSFACSRSFSPACVARLAHQGPRGKQANHPVTRSITPHSSLCLAIRTHSICSTTRTNRTLRSRRLNPV